MLELGGAVTEIVSNVCLTMLGLNVEPGSPRVAVPGERSMVACVQITGAWSGAVLVSCSPGFASLAAQTILECPGTPLGGVERGCNCGMKGKHRLPRPRSLRHP